MTQYKRTIAGKEHVCVVLKVTARDRLGRRSEVTISYDDTSFHIEGGEEFLTAWVVAEAVAKRAS